ncbi:hypothetical protein ACRQ5Q_10215 [Bradyrhizobium sp. PMVTL-01]|uniref:hypothetical protein n=1 Tax=Bradyrhizobium sp. PMVTL-01 TaxID=3434999 RepID=UPI003F71F581
MTIGKWRRRFVQDRLKGLRHEPSHGVPRMINDASIDVTIVETLESLPKDATRWRGMANASADTMLKPTHHNGGRFGTIVYLIW